MTKKSIVKALVFILIFATGFFSIQALLTGDPDTRDYRRITDFFDQREGSLDAVFLGSSATYSFWNSAVAWEEHGITVYPFASAKQEILAAKYMIADAVKKHPDAVYIVNLTSVNEKYNFRIHRLIDGYPNTINKFRMINYLCDLGGHTLGQRMEFFFPIIRFHDRWSELTRFDFNPPEEKYKSSLYYPSYLSKTKDVSGNLWDYEGKSDVSEQLLEGLDELMDYCERKSIKLLFVLTPQSIKNEEKRGQQNTLIEYVASKGFDTLDMNKVVDEIGLDTTIDFYDREHTNLHGSIKTTQYLSRYLIENYNLEDKRGKEEFSDWTQAAELYYERISKHLIPDDYEYLDSLK